MSASASQSAYNVKTVSRQVAERLGVDPSNMTTEIRIGYLKAVAAEIVKYPQSFTEATLATARDIAGKAYQTEEDASFDYSAFLGGVIDNGVAINEDVNPLSASNRKAVFWVGIVGVVLYFVGPVLLTAFLKSKGSQDKPAKPASA